MTQFRFSSDNNDNRDMLEHQAMAAWHQGNRGVAAQLAQAAGSYAIAAALAAAETAD